MITNSQRRWRVDNPEKVRAYANSYKDRHPRRYEAHRIANNAIRRGDLVRPMVCEDCGRYNGWNNELLSGKGVIEAHHTDYTKPLNVEWLCRTCHDEESVSV